MDVNLIMFKSNGQQKAIPLTQASAVLGRGADCDIRIPVDSCSRRQCELTLDGESLSIRDLGSANGTFVNNEKVELQVLQAGDRLTLGPVTLTVQIDGMPAEIANDSGATAEDSGELIPMDDELDTSSANAEDDPIAALEALADEMD